MRLLIVEDEPLIAQRIERMCREILGAEMNAVIHAARHEDTAALLADTPIDLMLLDLNLSGADGMSLLATSVAGSFHTIIVSANTDRALEAFEYGVLDFVPKPFKRERLAQALDRMRGTFARTDCATKFLAIRKYGRIELVRVEDVLYAKGAGAYSELFLSNGSAVLHDKSLEKMQAVLPPVFERVHKSYLVRMSEVRALHAAEGSHYEAELRNGTRVPVGRSRYKEIRGKLG
ncbi:MAG TPA: LytTR family DNA-binding domain-containing protein [Opitutaceae bacterium]